MLHSSYRRWTLSTAIAKLLIAGVLLNSLTPHANTAVAQGPRLGEVCSGISRHFLENNYYDDVNIFGNLWRKPVKVSNDSLCAGMMGTCCKQSLEHDLLKAIEKMYSDRYQAALQKRIAPLATAGRRLNGAVFNIFKDTKDLLVAEVAKVMNKSQEGTNDIFNDLFDGIYKLVHTKNLCFLPNEVNTTIRMIFNDIYVRQWQLGQGKSDTATANITRCISALEETIVNMWYKPILRQLAPTLNNMKTIAESIDAINTVCLSLQRNKFSDSCMKAMFTMRTCADCSGYQKTVTCGGHCLNVLRGCMSEAVELTPRLKTLASKLKDLSRFVSRQLNPVLLTADTMSIFLSMTKHIKETLSRLTVNGANCSNIVSPYNSSALDRDRFSLYSTAVSSYSTPGGHETIAQIVDKELVHFSTLESVIMEIPEEFCSINPKLLKYIRNSDCWNGTAMASYTHSLVGHFEADQASNPAFERKQLVHTGQYRRLRNRIKRTTQVVDYLLTRYECLQRDDEDCEYQIQLMCMTRSPTTASPSQPNGEEGSGLTDPNGSGSGASDALVGSGGIDPSLVDTESSKQRIIIISDLAQNRFITVDPVSENQDTTSPPITLSTHVQPQPSDDNVETLEDTPDEDADYDTGEAPSVAVSHPQTSASSPSDTTSQPPPQNQHHQGTPSPSGGASSLSVSLQNSILITLASLVLVIYLSEQLHVL